MDLLSETIGQLSAQINILAEENDRNRNLIVALSKRVNAVIESGEEGNLAMDSVNEKVLAENVKELEQQVSYLVNMGVLNLDPGGEVSKRSFVVGQDLDKTGAVITPRVQFAVGSLEESLQEKLLGKKVHESIELDNDVKFEVLEHYTIVEIDKTFSEEQPVENSIAQ